MCDSTMTSRKPRDENKAGEPGHANPKPQLSACPPGRAPVRGTTKPTSSSFQSRNRQRGKTGAASIRGGGGGLVAGRCGAPESVQPASPALQEPLRPVGQTWFFYSGFKTQAERTPSLEAATQLWGVSPGCRAHGEQFPEGARGHHQWLPCPPTEGAVACQHLSRTTLVTTLEPSNILGPVWTVHAVAA